MTKQEMEAQSLKAWRVLLEELTGCGVDRVEAAVQCLTVAATTSHDSGATEEQFVQLAHDIWTLVSTQKKSGEPGFNLPPASA